MAARKLSEIKQTLRTLQGYINANNNYQGNNNANVFANDLQVALGTGPFIVGDGNNGSKAKVLVALNAAISNPSPANCSALKTQLNAITGYNPGTVVDKSLVTELGELEKIGEKIQTLNKERDSNETNRAALVDALNKITPETNGTLKKGAAITGLVAGTGLLTMGLTKLATTLAEGGKDAVTAVMGGSDGKTVITAAKDAVPAWTDNDAMLMAFMVILAASAITIGAIYVAQQYKNSDQREEEEKKAVALSEGSKVVDINNMEDVTQDILDKNITEFKKESSSMTKYTQSIAQRNNASAQGK